MADMDDEGHELNLMMAKAVADVICAEVSFPGDPCVPCLLGTLANVISMTLINAIHPSQYDDAIQVVMKDVRQSLARKMMGEAG